MKKTTLLMFLILAVLNSYCHAYDPPIGIPQPPSVLIDADVDMYIGQTYNFSLDGRGVLTYPISTITGHPYTHFVNAATGDDTNNPYGTEASPRKTLPIDSDQYPQDSSLWLAAGSVIEIHNGTYDPGDLKSLYVQGTADAPCFIRCTSSGHLGDFRLFVTGDYVIFEDIDGETTPGFQLYFTYTSAGYGGSNHGCDYVMVRNSTFKGTETEAEGSFSQVNGKPSGAGADDDVTYGVFYNNEISYFGDWDMLDPYPADQADDCGLYIWYKTDHIWVINNNIHHNGGDSIQIGNDSNRETQYIYVGGNTLHDERENPVDIKEAQDVIVSHNTMYNFTDQGQDDAGGGIPIHLGSMAGNDCPYNIWIIFNEIYNVTYYPIRISGGDLIYILGNVLRDVDDDTGGTEYGLGISTTNYLSTERHYIIGNTIENCNGGIWIENDNSDNANIYVYNNILDTLSETPGSGYKYHIYAENKAATVSFDNNLVYQSGGNISIKWGSTTYSSLSAFQSGESVGLNCVAGDPLFVDAGNDDFHLDTGSPAIGTALSSGIVDTAFSNFQSLYGIDIKKDIEGKTRTEPWDMGAYESDGTSSSGQYLIALIERMKNQMYTVQKVSDYKMN